MGGGRSWAAVPAEPPGSCRAEMTLLSCPKFSLYVLTLISRDALPANPGKGRAGRFGKGSGFGSPCAGLDPRPGGSLRCPQLQAVL